MKILFISKYFPGDFAEKSHGVYKRMDLLLDALSEISQIDLLYYVSPEELPSENDVTRYENLYKERWTENLHLTLCPMDRFSDNNELAKWLSFAKGAFSIYNQKGYMELSGPVQIKALEDRVKLGPDAVFAHRLSAMCPIMKTNLSLPPVFFDLDDIEHIVLDRYISLQKSSKSKLLKLVQKSLKSGEKRAVRKADATFVCSEDDVRYLNEQCHVESVLKVPNAVDIPKPQTLTDDSSIMFLGNSYKPNVDAASYLIEEIWPLVYKKKPNAKLIIAGSVSEGLSTEIKSQPGVTTTGYVEDLDSLYQVTRVVCVPLFSGGGTRIKIIEAAAYGKPVVSTTVGAEGLEFADGEEILIRDSAESLADTCLQLLEDKELCASIGSRSRSKVIELYDRNNVVDLIKRHILNKIDI